MYVKRQIDLLIAIILLLMSVGLHTHDEDTCHSIYLRNSPLWWEGFPPKVLLGGDRVYVYTETQVHNC
jgi:hypothetical protein